MSILLNDTIQNNSPKPVDNKFGLFVSGAFRAYTSTTEANSSINSAFRYVGLTILVSSGGNNTEYWYKAGTADSDLVPKIVNIGAASPLIYGSGTVSIPQSTSSQDGYISAVDWSAFSGRVTTATNLGTGQGVWAGTSPSLSGSTINLKSISPVANTGLTMSANGTDIQISINGIKEFSASTTSDATPTVVGSIVIEDNSAGFVEVSMVAVSTTPGSALVSKKYLAYQKISGILSNLGITTDLVGPALSGFTTASWDIVLNSSTNNLDIEVTGEVSSIKWLAKSVKYFNL